MSTYSDQLEQWMSSGIEQLRDDVRDHPDWSWAERQQAFLAALGIGSADDHPMVRSLVDHIEYELSDEQRADFLGGERLDSYVSELAAREAVAYEAALAAEPQALGEEADSVAPQEVREPAEVSEQVVRELALPILRELAETRPDLVAEVSVDELVNRLGQVLTEHLAVS